MKTAYLMGEHPTWPARGAAVVGLTARDGIRFRAKRQFPPGSAKHDGALRAAVGWLGLTHQVTGCQGSSKGFSLLRGWLPAYPETTGYVLGTLLEYAARTGEDGWVRDAVDMGDWEITVRRDDGGVVEGAVGTIDRSVVFNTGMVLHGWRKAPFRIHRD